MSEGRRKLVRYSHAFKQKVVNEIEAGKISVVGAKRLYDITGAETIQQVWSGNPPDQKPEYKFRTL